MYVARYMYGRERHRQKNRGGTTNRLIECTLYTTRNNKPPDRGFVPTSLGLCLEEITYLRKQQQTTTIGAANKCC